jgi:tRNA dimethylallyltransferase
LSIGVAKPSQEELTSVPHYFINSHSIHESVNAGIFEKYALEKVQEIFLKNEANPDPPTTICADSSDSCI